MVRGFRSTGFLASVALALALPFSLLSGLTPAGAQENLDAGKSPAQLFASDCSICHKTAQGLAKSGGMFGLTSFLREHYTASRETAASLAAYLQQVEGEKPAGKPRQARRAKPGDKPKGSEAKKPGEAKPDAKPSDNKADEPKATEKKPDEPKAESKATEAKAPESKPAEAKPAEKAPDAPKAEQAKTSAGKPADAGSEKKE